MVNPQMSWQQFQRPQTQEQPQPNQNLPQPEGETPQDTDQEPESYSWGQFQTNNGYVTDESSEEKESSLEWLTRNVLSHTARVGEQVAGAAGNLYKAGQDLLANAPSSAGIFGHAIHSWIGDEKWKQMIYGQEGAQGIKPPTSENIQKVTEGLTGEYTKPKNEAERKSQRFVSDVGNTLISKRPLSLWNNLGIPALANVVEGAIEGLGFGEDKASKAKLATWMGLSLIGNVNGQQEAARMVNEGRKGLPQYLRADVPRYSKKIDALERTMLHNDPRAEFARNQLTGIRNDISNGQLSVQELMNRYDSINAMKESRGLFELSPKVRQSAIKNVNNVLNTVREEIQEVGRGHPEALKNWSEGMQAYSVIHRSKRMTNWIDRTVRGPYGKIVTPIGLALFGVGSIKGPIATATGATAAPLAYKGYQIAYRAWNDPNLARYYRGAIAAAAAENTPAFVSNMQKLEASYEKKAKEKGWELPTSPHAKANNQKSR